MIAVDYSVESGCYPCSRCDFESVYSRLNHHLIEMQLTIPFLVTSVFLNNAIPTFSVQSTSHAPYCLTYGRNVLVFLSSLVHWRAGLVLRAADLTPLLNLHWKVGRPCISARQDESPSASLPSQRSLSVDTSVHIGVVSCLRSELAPFNIATLLVEPGNFRTDIMGPIRMKTNPTTIEDYVALSDELLEGCEAEAGTQPGDPRKGVERIIDVVKGEGIAKGRKMPERLPLGRDALKGIREKCEETLRLCDEWEDLISSTDYQ